MARLSKILSFSLLLTVCLPAQVLRVNHGLIPAASGTWDPTSETGLKLWLKADVGVYKDLGTTLASTGDTVEQWNDQSGLGNHFVQLASSVRPVFRTGLQNGLPGVVFTNAPSSGMTNFMTIAAGNLTIAFAVKTSNTTVEEELFDTQTGRLLVNYNDNNTAGDMAYYDGTHDVQAAAGFSTTWHTAIWCLNSTGTGGFAYLDNVQKVNGLYTQRALGGVVGIGDTYDMTSGPFSGPIGEVIIYDHDVGTTVRGNLQTYLKNRWATP